MPKTFKWRVTSGSSAEHEFKVRTVQFGDGYEQRQPLGLVPKLQSWDLKWVGRKAEMLKVKAFLDARRGVEAFYWQPPGRDPILGKVTSYSETPQGGLVYELSFKFEEVLA